MVTLHEEEASLAVDRRPYARVKVRKRVVTETRTVEVEVRREELVFEPRPESGGDAVATPTQPVEVVLHEEQVTVVRTVVPVERVRVHVVRVDTPTDLSTALSKEQVEVIETRPGQHPLVTAPPATPTQRK